MTLKRNRSAKKTAAKGRGFTRPFFVRSRLTCHGFLTFAHHPPPPRGREARRLLEPAGEVTLMGKPAVAGNRRKLLFTREQFGLGLMDLAFQEELLGSKPQQLGKAAVEMERTQLHLFRDL